MAHSKENISPESVPEKDLMAAIFIRQRLANNGPGDFPGNAVVKTPPASAGDMGSSSGPGRSHMPQSS